ncbi:hypothetical protein HD554DRAFT_930399 [Boletus coccyginus]|nr:hypothetical protein HD554DRAFT_930399 [Boletus coccyginus]
MDQSPVLRSRELAAKMMMLYSISSCHRAHRPHYLILMSHPRQRRLSSLSMPPMIPSAEMSDPKPTSDNPASSEKKHRTIGEWFGTVITKRNHDWTPRQTPSEAPPQSAIPSRTKATPSNEKHSTIAPAKRKRLIAYKYPARPQKKAAPKPAASSKPTKTTPPPEPGPANVSHETKADRSGVQNNASQSEASPSSVPEGTKADRFGVQNNASQSEAGPSSIPDGTKTEPCDAQNNVEREHGGLVSYKVNISFSILVPSWICCARAGNSDGMH